MQKHPKNAFFSLKQPETPLHSEYLNCAVLKSGFRSSAKNGEFLMKPSLLKNIQISLSEKKH